MRRVTRTAPAGYNRNTPENTGCGWVKGLDFSGGFCKVGGSQPQPEYYGCGRSPGKFRAGKANVAGGVRAFVEGVYMLSQEKLFCQEKKKVVMAMVEKKGSCKNLISCNEMLFCSGTTFCRYVNPLTTRNPLTALEDQPVQA